jgi:hypothetical protein
VLASRLSPCHLLNRPGIHQSIFIKGLKENTIAEEIIFLVEERQEGGYQAKALGDAIFTEADTMIKLKMPWPATLRATDCHLFYWISVLLKFPQLASHFVFHNPRQMC